MPIPPTSPRTRRGRWCKQSAAQLGAVPHHEMSSGAGPESISLYYGKGDSDTVDYHPCSGVLHRVVRKDRWLLRELNYLHLNEARGAWTYIADAFALLLVFLAISGAVMTKGRHGLKGRGGVFAAIGLLIPILALIAAHSVR